MFNFRVTPNNQLKEREGYSHLITGLTGIVQGQWYGKLNSINYYLFCNHGHLYNYDLTYAGIVTDLTTLIGLNVITDLGTLTDAPTTIINFGTKVYLFNGHEYKSFNGVVATPSTNSLITVVGIRPRKFINAPPTGGGTPFQLNNELNGLGEGTFTPDQGVTTVYKVSSYAITSIDYVYKNEVLMVLGTDYTASVGDLALGQFTWTVSPTGNVVGSIRAGWTQGTGNRTYIEKCLYAMDYSGQTDARLFIWGDPTNKSRRRWTGLDNNGVPSAEYFESTSYDDLGAGQYAITSIVKQYDRQKIFLENSAMWSEYTTFTDAGGITRASFPAYELNDEIGNMAANQCQIVKNKPFSIYNGVHAWEPTYVRDQTDENLISQRVQDSLITNDLTTAVTYNWKENNEYWLCIPSVGIIWVYNYLNNTWYKFKNIYATNFIVINNEMYFGTNGTIEKFDPLALTDNGTAISPIWEMGFYAFEREDLTKYSNYCYVAIKPQVRSSLDVQVVTNNDGTSEKETIYYNLATFKHCDFRHFSFHTSYNPQPFKVEIQAMGFCYYKLILSNSSTTNSVTVLSINIPIRYGGKI